MWQRQQSHTEFDPEYKDASLITEISVANESAAALAGTAVKLSLMQGEQKVSRAIRSSLIWQHGRAKTVYPSSGFESAEVECGASGSVYVANRSFARRD